MPAVARNINSIVRSPLDVRWRSRKPLLFHRVTTSILDTGDPYQACCGNIQAKGKLFLKYFNNS